MEQGRSQSHSSPVRKQKRAFHACDFCHRRGLRCKPQGLGATKSHALPQALSCLTCIEYGQQCTRSRQPRKRGTKPRSKDPSRNTALDCINSGLDQQGASLDSSRLTSRCHEPHLSSVDKDDSTSSVRLYPIDEASYRPQSPNSLETESVPKTFTSSVNDFGISHDGSFKSRENISAMIDVYLDSIHPV